MAVGCSRDGRPRVGGVKALNGGGRGGRSKGVGSAEAAGERGRSRTSASLGSRTETFYVERP